MTPSHCGLHCSCRRLVRGADFYLIVPRPAQEPSGSLLLHLPSDFPPTATTSHLIPPASTVIVITATAAAFSGDTSLEEAATAVTMMTAELGGIRWEVVKVAAEEESDGRQRRLGGQKSDGRW